MNKQPTKSQLIARLRGVQKFTTVESSDLRNDIDAQFRNIGKQVRASNSKSPALILIFE